MVECTLAVQELKYLLTYDPPPDLEEKKKYETNNKRETFILLSSVSPVETLLVSGCTSAKENWTKLNNKYRENSESKATFKEAAVYT